jgi:CPA1 family monovalent cation:H+ antiporter
VRERLEALVLVFAVGSAVAIAAKRVGSPYNVSLVVVGLLLVFMKVLPRTTLDPEIILVAFFPVLVFEGALFAELDQLRSAYRAIVFLAVPGMVISVLTTAAVATLALDLPFKVALLLGALLAITDTVSVLLAFRTVRVPARLAAIMEGESLFNDGTALVLVAVTVAVVERGGASPFAVARAFALATLGGVALGAALGALGALVLERTPDHLTAILASLVLVFATSLAAERIHTSPVIAVVVVGLIVGRAARKNLGPSRVLALEGFWEVAGFGLNVLIFLRVGMQIDAGVLVQEARSIGLALLAMHVGRAAAVYGGFFLLRVVGRDPVPLSWQHAMVFGNIKGSLSMAAVLALPMALDPYRSRLVAIVFGVTFVTLITQALPFKRVLRWLGLTQQGADSARLDRARARLLAARRGQGELDALLSSGLISRRAHAERRATYQAQVVDAEAVLRAHHAEGQPDVHVEIALLNAQKASLTEAARSGVVSPETVTSFVEEIDEALMRLREHAEHRQQ